MKIRNALVFTLILLVAVLAAACQPETIIETVVVEGETVVETIVETVVVEKEGETIIETVVVEKEVEVEVPGGGSRGSSGTLNILYWQAASTLNAYLSGGTKDIHAGASTNGVEVLLGAFLGFNTHAIFKLGFLDDGSFWADKWAVREGFRSGEGDLHSQFIDGFDALNIGKCGQCVTTHFGVEAVVTSENHVS